MSDQPEIHPDLDALARSDGRYDAQAFGFVGEGLRHAARLYGKDAPECSERHLGASQLVEGVLDLAAERFGVMAELVLRSWGLRASEDVGRITFKLIETGIFSKQPSDSIDDFACGPSFAAELATRAQRRVAVRLAKGGPAPGGPA